MQIEGGLTPKELHPFGESMPEFIEYVCGEGKCGSCKMPVLWCRTKNAKRIPMDLTAKPVNGKMISHFAVCPDAKQFRKSKPKKEG